MAQEVDWELGIKDNRLVSSRSALGHALGVDSLGCKSGILQPPCVVAHKLGIQDNFVVWSVAAL